MNRKLTKRIRIYGIVQGVGFRPAVSRTARETGITGCVSNRGSYVEITARGTETQIALFIKRLKSEPPKRAVILKMDVKDVEGAAQEFASFEIAESVKESGESFISPDIAICDECAAELYDPSNRRYLHPFINCTSCGPRLTILDSLPYDRKRTSMRSFPMCASCEEEYYNPASRRYDAQPVCCNDCGPELYITGRPERGADAIRYARSILASGGIAAVKGIGGFHLCCDASSEQAVRRLRKLKSRPVKPFAVMMKDISVVERECVIHSDVQRSILTGYQKPILLLEKQALCAENDAEQPECVRPLLCEDVAPGNPKVGVMLPYAPVQMLLFDYPDVNKVSDMLVMTSGNVSGAPICKDDDEAVSGLSGFCDCILSNDREIKTRCDDSVMDFTGGGPYMIRRSRGYAPLPVILSSENEDSLPAVLAVGGELKNTFCIGKGNLFYPSSYTGDLADPRSVQALYENIKRFETMLGIKPQAVACDMHPGYNSTRLAAQLGAEYGVPVIQVQHHYAHIASCMAENDCTGPVLGASFDGTGYGTDGTIWGGEILLADYDSFRRLGSIIPFDHVGGDTASREGWRIAASMLRSCGDMEAAGELSLCSREQISAIWKMARSGFNTVRSTSVGRFFDAVSAVLGICKVSTFEGEASCALQYAAEGWRRNHPDEARGTEKAACGIAERIAAIKNMDCRETGSEGNAIMKMTAGEVPKRADKDFIYMRTDALFNLIVQEKKEGKDTGYLSYLFHAVLAQQTAAALSEARGRTGINICALSGGVYQNTLLLKLTKDLLEAAGFRVLTHHLIPPNDGGLCLGQAVAVVLKNNRHSGQ